MAEERQKQPLQRILEDEDQISRLPDCLLAEILSRLPETKYAIRTGALSKRWRHIWTLVHSLSFVHTWTTFSFAHDDDDDGDGKDKGKGKGEDEDEDNRSPSYFSFVDKTLAQRRQMKLKKFMLDIFYNSKFESHIHKWIRYAVNCNVEDLKLKLWRVKHETEPRFKLRNPRRITEFSLGRFVYTCSSFTDMTLSGCSFNSTWAISWENLRSLRILYGKLEEDMIENILSGSPVLETLVLDNCYGYKRLDITSKSLKTLVLRGDGYISALNLGDDKFEINAPNILSLKIQDDVYMRKLLLVNVSSLVEAHLDYSHRTTAAYVEEMLEGLILMLRHVKVVKVGGYCCKVLDRLEAKGFIRPSNLKVP